MCKWLAPFLSFVVLFTSCQPEVTDPNEPVPVTVTPDSTQVIKSINFAGTDADGVDFDITELYRYDTIHRKVLIERTSENPGSRGTVELTYDESGLMINYQSTLFLDTGVYGRLTRTADFFYDAGGVINEMRCTRFDGSTFTRIFTKVMQGNNYSLEWTTPTPDMKYKNTTIFNSNGDVISDTIDIFETVGSFLEYKRAITSSYGTDGGIQARQGYRYDPGWEVEIFLQDEITERFPRGKNLALQYNLIVGKGLRDLRISSPEGPEFSILTTPGVFEPFTYRPTPVKSGKQTDKQMIPPKPYHCEVVIDSLDRLTEYRTVNFAWNLHEPIKMSINYYK